MANDVLVTLARPALGSRLRPRRHSRIALGNAVAPTIFQPTNLV